LHISSLTLLLTDDCNYSCSYCYQTKAENYLSFSSIKKALDFFLQYLRPKSFINFSGGEPLLAFGRLQESVEYLQSHQISNKKQLKFTLTTNGSLLDKNIIEFLSAHEFRILFSFDGTAQESTRSEGSFKDIAQTIRVLLNNPRIELKTNSVFTPATVRNITESIRFISKLGVPDISISLDQGRPWDVADLDALEEELVGLRYYLKGIYRTAGTIPVIKYRNPPEKHLFECTGGKDRMALSPDGTLWGCYLFAEYFKGKEHTEEYQKFCFGDVDSIASNYFIKFILNGKSYSDLKMSCFYSPHMHCADCEELSLCRVCPVIAAFTSQTLGKIPSWTCEIQKIWRREKEAFWSELKNSTNYKPDSRI